LRSCARLERLARAASNGSLGSGNAPLAIARARPRRAQQLERSHRVVPAETGIGDALPIDERRRIVLAGGELLRARLRVARDHAAEDAAPACLELRSDVARDVDLARVQLAAVGVAAIDHQRARQLG